MPELEKLDLTPYKDNPVAMFNYMNEFMYLHKSEANHILDETIVKLNKDSNFDFCEMGLQAMDAGVSCWDVIHVLKDAIPSLNLNKSTLLKLFSVFYKKMENDFAVGEQYKIIVNLVEKQPEFSRDLLNELLRINEPFVAGYISAICTKLGSDDIEKTHAEIISLLAEYAAAEHSSHGLITSLSRIPYDNQMHGHLINSTVDLLKNSIIYNPSLPKSAITYSLCNLIRFEPGIKNTILELLEGDDLQVKFQVASYLVLNRRQLDIDDWFDKALLKFVNIDSRYLGIIDCLDTVLSELIVVPTGLFLAKKFLFAWLVNNQYDGNSVKIKKIFDSTFYAILKLHKDRLNILLTELFNDDNSKMHFFAAEIVYELSHNEKCRLGLDSGMIKELSYADILYISRKILGYIHSPRPLCSLLYSIFESSLDENVLSLMYSVFITFIGVEFPGATVAFLREVQNESDDESKIKPIVKAIIDSIDNEQKRKENLPKLKELEPPSRLLRQVHREEQKNMSKLMELRRKESVFMNLFPAIPIKHGKGWFNYMDGQYSSPHLLSEYSHSIELPSSVAFHPISAALSKASFRIVKRGEQ